MPHVLNLPERNALEKLSSDRNEFVIKGKLAGIGERTLDSLVRLGLAETGPSERYYGEIGWRITADGWRCMYGKTFEEMMAGGKQVRPLSVWRWPPE